MMVTSGNQAVATPQAREAARRVCRAQADARAAALAPVIAEMRASGITTPYAIAAALTARGIPTARGHRFWLAGPVRSVLKRIDWLSDVGALDLQEESQRAPTRLRKARTQKALLSRNALMAALRELS
jgi:hypothetical protein